MWLTDEAKIPRRAFTGFAQKAWFLLALTPWRATAEMTCCGNVYFNPCGTQPCHNHGTFAFLNPGGTGFPTQETCQGPNCQVYTYRVSSYCCGYIEYQYTNQCCPSL